MHKLVILVETPEDETAFNDEWPLFLFLAERMPGLRRESTSHVDKMLFGDSSYSLIHELYFDSLAELKEAMSSKEGRLAGTQLQKMTRGRVTLLIADHQEDSLEHIQQYSSGVRTDTAGNPPAETPQIPVDLPAQERTDDVSPQPG